MNIRMINMSARKKLSLKVITVIAVFILLALSLGVTYALVVLFFMAAFLWQVDMAIPLSVAVAILVLCAFLLLINQSSNAIRLANWAYCFFAIGVSRLFYVHLRASWKREDDRV